MTRVFSFMAVALVVTALCSALAVTLGIAALPVTPGSIVVAYAALATPPIEAAFSAVLVGLVVDALSGTSLGASSFSLLVTLLVSRLGVSLVPSTRDRFAIAFVGVFASAQALLAMALLALFGQSHARLDVVVVVVVGALDALVAIAVFPLLHVLFVLLRLEERSATLRERLQAR
jgi:cell shape-determining protein MreD